MVIFLSLTLIFYRTYVKILFSFFIPPNDTSLCCNRPILTWLHNCFYCSLWWYLLCVTFPLSRCYSWQTVQNPRYVLWSSLSFMGHSSQAMPATHAECFLQSWEGRMLKICSQLCWVQQPHSQLLCHSLLPHHSSCLCTAKVCSSGAFGSSSLAGRVLNADVEVGRTSCCPKLWNLPLLICEILF